MKLRPLHLLLLVALAYWVSGAAMFLHERMEHGDGDADESAVALAVEHGDSQSPDHSKHHRHNHDDCPTCQLLAHMMAQPTAAPAAVVGHLPLVDVVVACDAKFLVVEVLPFARAGGRQFAAWLSDFLMDYFYCESQRRSSVAAGHGMQACRLS